MNAKASIVVCVPARNEAAHLPRLLDALASQTQPAKIVIALNNTTDASLQAIAESRVRFGDLDVLVDETTFGLADAHAGSARRRAMDAGASLAGPDGILITTDADARPPPTWIAANIAALADGLDLVGGQIRLDDNEAISPAITAAFALGGRYWERVRAIEDAIDPVPWDPPPRHGDHTGASLALRVADYLVCRDALLIPSGEDRALVRAVCSRGGKLGHPPGVWTRVSARTVGRAQNGMADAMARAALPDTPFMLPHFRHWEQRARWRRDIRDRFGAAEIARREPELASMPCDMTVTPSTVGESTSV